MLIPSGDGADKHTAENSQARSHNIPSLALLCVFFSIQEDKESEKFRLYSAGGREPWVSVGDAAQLPSRGYGCTVGHSPVLSGPSFAGNPEGRGAHTGSSCWDLRGFCAHPCCPETISLHSPLCRGLSRQRVLLSKERCEILLPAAQQPSPSSGKGCAGGHGHKGHQRTFLSLSTPLVKRKPPGRAVPAQRVQLAHGAQSCGCLEAALPH